MGRKTYAAFSRRGRSDQIIEGLGCKNPPENRFKKSSHGATEKVMINIIETLSGDAAAIANDIDSTVLFSNGGFKELAQRLYDHCFAQKSRDSNLLYTIGHNETGPLSRQRGEPMQSYCNRRRKWYARLKDMSHEGAISMSDHLLGGLLFRSSRLNDMEKADD